MITKLLYSFMRKIASMSKKSSAIYLALLSLLFLLALGLLITGLILLNPKDEAITTLSIVLTSIGGFGLLVSVFGVALTAIASNYVRRSDEKSDKK